MIFTFTTQVTEVKLIYCSQYLSNKVLLPSNNYHLWWKFSAETGIILIFFKNWLNFYRWREQLLNMKDELNISYNWTTI